MLQQGVKYLFSRKKRALYIGSTGTYSLGDEAVFLR